MSGRRSRCAGAALLAILGGCGAPAAILVSETYDPTQARLVEVAPLRDFAGEPGSGLLAADAMRRVLARAGYAIAPAAAPEAAPRAGADPAPAVPRADTVLEGEVTDAAPARDRTAFASSFAEETGLVYGGGPGEAAGRVASEPEEDPAAAVESLPARIGFAVRLRDAQTGEVLWSAFGTARGDSEAAAAGEAASGVLQQLVLHLPAR